MAGPFSFAWVPPGTPWDESLVGREDEAIFSISIEHDEGNFAALTLVVVNPKIGLLAAGRNLWCWLAWDSGSGVVPVFNGRLVGIPADLAGETVALEFVAMPPDYTARVTALAAAMMVPPYWDPIWIQAGIADPDTVLETYSMLWHIDRTTLDVTASDIIAGEDGVLEVFEGDHFYDGLTVSYGATPQTSINVTGIVTWDQIGTGEVDLTGLLVAAFQTSGSPVDSPLVSSLTGPGLLDSWPLPNTPIGGGWTVGPSSTIAEASWLSPVSMGVHFLAQAGAATPSNPPVGFSALFPLGIYAVTFTGAYAADRARSEIVQFTLNADVQPLVSDSGIPPVPTALSLSSNFIALPVDPGGALPIGDPGRPSYFKTDRGQESFQYLLLLARAQLLASARAVNLTFATTWEKAIGLSCRWSVKLHDRRLPGGNAVGKVTSYKLTYSEAGIGGAVTLGCTCGSGGTVAASDGTPEWADGYVDDGYQVNDGETIDVGAAAITYESFTDFVLDDDQLDLFNMTAATCVETIVVAGGVTAQKAAIDTGLGLTPPDPSGQLSATPTVVTVQLVPVTGGAFQTIFNPVVSDLMVPKTIDLEAPTFP